MLDCVLEDKAGQPWLVFPGKAKMVHLPFGKTLDALQIARLIAETAAMADRVLDPADFEPKGPGNDVDR